VKIGVGLPSSIPETAGEAVFAWAGSAESRGFDSLAVLDRLAYPNYEPVVTLAAAAGATTGIRLAATVLTAAYRRDAVVLAKQLASVHRLSGGRLTVGFGAGDRPADFTSSGAEFGRRGRLLDETLDAVRATWSGDPVGPRVADAPPEVLVGGHSAAALVRAARAGAGWIAGGGSSVPIAERFDRVRKAWADAGRTDQPRLVALRYFCLGPDGAATAARYLRGYYGFLGPGYANRVAASCLAEPAQLRETARAYADAGCDELVLIPCSPDRRQLDLLTEVVR
jgi:alkanesulfonate monooxygenase SsuD/methylene tetrahydromethanopterin reductase-like flavin-dependent oxidoreductase (luciferase family)